MVLVEPVGLGPLGPQEDAVLGGPDAEGIESVGDPVSGAQQVRSTTRVCAHVRRTRTVAIQHVADALVDRHRPAMRSGGLVGNGQRVGDEVFLEGELPHLVVELLHLGDVSAAGVVSHQVAQGRRPASSAQVASPVDRMESRLLQSRGVPNVVQPGRCDQEGRLVVIHGRREELGPHGHGLAVPETFGVIRQDVARQVSGSVDQLRQLQLDIDRGSLPGRRNHLSRRGVGYCVGLGNWT